RSAVMSKLRIVHGLLGLVLALCIPHGPARAQSFVTFVSGNGLDTNPCTRGQPCKTFSTALGVTLENGSIIVLDAADYGPVVLKKPVSIVNDNAGPPADVNAALATVAGTGQIVVTAGDTGVVTLRGLVLNGVGASNFIGMLVTNA